MDKSFPDRFGRPQLITSRIQALVKTGALEGRGILFKTGRAPPSAIRFGEVRLPPRPRHLRKRSR
jgi:hypothetical protein